MPVLKKEIELNNGKKIWVRQASGMDKLKIEKLQTKVFRELRHFGTDVGSWTEAQQEEFANKLDEIGGGLDAQIETWIPKCILDETLDVNTLTSEELMTILRFVRGDETDGAIPLV